jgi:hypothetical protein
MVDSQLEAEQLFGQPAGHSRPRVVRCDCVTVLTSKAPVSIDEQEVAHYGDAPDFYRLSHAT